MSPGYLESTHAQLSSAFNASGHGIAVGYDRVASEEPSYSAVFGVGAGYATTNINSICDSVTVMSKINTQKGLAD